MSTVEAGGPRHESHERNWTPGEVRAWWVQFYAKRLAAIGGALVASIVSARALGVKFDVQTETASRIEREKLRTEMREEAARSYVGLWSAINALDVRIDNTLLIKSVQVRGCEP